MIATIANAPNIGKMHSVKNPLNSNISLVSLFIILKAAIAQRAINCGDEYRSK